MAARLNLIKTDFQELENRTFPRFPISYMMFKPLCNESCHAFEVVDISHTGMQLSLRDGSHTFCEGDNFKGALHWRGKGLELSCQVMWSKGTRLGVSFENSAAFTEQITDFLSVENIVASMRPIHQSNLDLATPSNLKYWLQADGPVEIFIWTHLDGEISRFNFIMMGSFLEWCDGKGLRTGKVLTKRNSDTPLLSEDKFVFQIDEALDGDKMIFAEQIIKLTPEHFLTPEILEFLKLKIHVNP